MAENVTPVVLKVKDFAPREVLLVNWYRPWRTADHPREGAERW